MKAFVLALLASATSLGPGPDFSLLPAATCREGPAARQCQVAGPKEWSAAERQLVQVSMRRLATNELIQGLLVAARENGYAGFQRYSTDTKQDPSFGTVPMFNPGFVRYDAKVIGITDAYFQTENVRDSISDYRFGDLILIHELAHAFDDRKSSAEQGFTTVAGWVFRNSRWEYAKRVSFTDYLGVYAETLTLYADGRYREAWTRDRSFATSLTFPVPTIQSLVSPDESFADILAHLIVDTRATTYLQPELVAWFERNVFPVLTEKARRFRATEYDLF